MNTTFFKPRQGDTASVVADGYASNFETLDTAKADAQAVAEALAGKVDKADGKELMTSAEREKLSGIEAGANAYTLPAATASTLGGIKAGDNVTITPDGTLSAGEYVLPKASSTVLGGIKVGRNLSIDAEGCVSAVGGSGDGGGIVVLPYVAPQRDADGNLTNSAAFVAAWGGILSEYLAAPDAQALYMYMDVADGMQLKVPCTLMKVDQSETTDTYYMFASQIVGMPGASTSLMPVKTLCLTALVCTKEHVLQQVPIYLVEGIMTSGGQPNLLGTPVAILDISNVNPDEEAQLKTALQPIVTALIGNPSSMVVMCDKGWSTPMAVTKWMASGDNTRYVMLAHMVGIKGVENDGVNLTSMIIDCECTGTGALVTAKYTVTSGDIASRKYVQDYVRQEIPQPRYRNLCLNSRGDNLNCWVASWGTSTVTVDYGKFGYPVICVETTLDGAEATPIKAISGDDNIPAIREIIGHKGGKGVEHDIVISYDIYSESSTTVYEGCHSSFPHLPYTSGTPVIANQWRRIVSKVPAGTAWDYFMLGYIRDAYMGHKMYLKNIQIEYGTEATPYCYTAVLSDSQEEQLVPGEFWMSADGVKRKVYVKTVQGTTSAIGSYGASVTRLLSGITSASIQHIDVSNTMGVNDTSNNMYLQIDLDHCLNLVTTSPEQAARPYILTFKYTKS